VDGFLRLSVILTGYEQYELLGTGMLMPYYDELMRIIGAREAGALLGAFSGLADGDDEAFRRASGTTSSSSAAASPARPWPRRWPTPAASGSWSSRRAAGPA
jgi:hypothetical protein